MPKVKKAEKTVDKPRLKAVPKASEKPEKTAKKAEFFYAVGRRRESSARVRLYPISSEKVKIADKEYSKGEIIVNSRPVSAYFFGKIYEKLYMEPFRTTNTVGRFTTTAVISGGGIMGQVRALVHGISRALIIVDEEKFRPMLRKKGFITRDPRAKERRKAGNAQKARAKKQSPKR